VPQIQKVQKQVQVPQVRANRKEVDVPVIKHVEIEDVQYVEKYIEVPQVQVVEKVVEVPQMESLQGRELHEYIPMPPERRQAPREYASLEEVGEDLPLEIAPPIYETREGVLHVEQKAMGTFPPATSTPSAFSGSPGAFPPSQVAGCSPAMANSPCPPFMASAASDISQISQVRSPFGVPSGGGTPVQTPGGPQGPRTSMDRVPQAFASGMASDISQVRPFGTASPRNPEMQAQEAAGMASDISQISQVRPFGTASPRNPEMQAQEAAGMASDISQISQVRPFGTASPRNPEMQAQEIPGMASNISQISQVAPFGVPATAGFSSGGLFEAPAQASLPPTVPPSPVGSMISQWPTEQVLPMISRGGAVMPQPGAPFSQANVSPMPTAQVGMPEPLPAQNLQSQAPLSARQLGTGDFGMRPAEQMQEAAAQAPDRQGWLSWLFGGDSGTGQETRQAEQYLVPRGTAAPEMSAFPMPRSPCEAAHMHGMQMQQMQSMPQHQMQLQSMQPHQMQSMQPHQMQFMEQQRLEQQRQIDFEQMRHAEQMREMHLQHAQMQHVNPALAANMASPYGWQDPYASGFGPTPIGHQGGMVSQGPPAQWPSMRPMPPTSFTGY